MRARSPVISKTWPQSAAEQNARTLSPIVGFYNYA